MRPANQPQSPSSTREKGTKQMELELGLSLSLPHQYHPISGILDLDYGPAKCKPLYPIAASCEEPRDPNYLTTLSLFCTHHSGDDDDEAGDGSKSLCQRNATISSCQDEKNVVGWPPVKSWRRNHIGGRDSTQGQEMNGAANYVKVKMDGMAIGRKVDLAHHHSYQTLISALTAMFGIEDDGAVGIHSSYSFSYKDKQGRWLILGGVPWGVFVQSVQRLPIVRNIRPNYMWGSE